jgi:hypothetical protein
MTEMPHQGLFAVIEKEVAGRHARAVPGRDQSEIVTHRLMTIRDHLSVNIEIHAKDGRAGICGPQRLRAGAGLLPALDELTDKLVT